MFISQAQWQCKILWKKHEPRYSGVMVWFLRPARQAVSGACWGGWMWVSVRWVVQYSNASGWGYMLRESRGLWEESRTTIQTASDEAEKGLNLKSLYDLPYSLFSLKMYGIVIIIMLWKHYYCTVEICIKLMLILTTSAAVIATTLPTCLLKFSTDDILITLYNDISFFRI